MNETTGGDTTMRVIYVPVADRPECAVALKTAFSLGHSVGASVIGCHIRPHRDSPVALSSGFYQFDQNGNETEWQVAAKPENGKKAQEAAGVLFSRLAEHHGYKIFARPRAGPGAVWMEKTGAPNKVIGIMGPVADLLVVSRPARNGGGVARMFLSAALLRSSRPVLVLPQNGKTAVGKNICIAWNQSVEAARAVAAAMPLLLKADTVSIVSSGSESQFGPSSSQLATYLKYWGIKAERFTRKGKDEQKEVLEMYRASESDLLVMGAYSRSRMSRLVFGGLTQHMLEKASIPVFMLHT